MDADFLLFLFLSFLLWLFGRINGKKRPRPARRKRENIYAEPGAAMQEQLAAYRQEMVDRADEVAYTAGRQAEEAAIRAEEQAEYVRQAKLPSAPQEPKTPLQLTPENTLSAMALSVVLGPPAARRHDRYRWHH